MAQPGNIVSDTPRNRTRTADGIPVPRTARGSAGFFTQRF